MMYDILYFAEGTNCGKGTFNMFILTLKYITQSEENIIAILSETFLLLKSILLLLLKV